MQNAIININGQIQGPSAAKISVFDRAYLYGDSLSEVLRTYRGQFWLLDEHLSRLEKSAELCRMTLGQSRATYRDEIHRTYKAFQAKIGKPNVDAYIRLIVSRGNGKIGFGLPCLETSTLFTIIVQPLEAPTPEQFKKGIKVKIGPRLRNDRRALDPAMKSGNYLNSVLAYLEASFDGYDDALLCNSENHVTEGTTFNIFYSRRGILATPPLDIGILDGITRMKVIQLAKDLNIPVREVRFPKERLYEADEVFLTSSIREVLPITQVDQIKIGKGVCGPITQALQDRYQKHVFQELT